MRDDRLARGRRIPGRRRRNRVVVTGLALALSAVSIGAGTARAANPLNGRGMWIWYVSNAQGGDLSSIIAAAHSRGLHTVFIKSGDGTGAWSQFSSQLVSTLHANGLRVCGWQYVYGASPAQEATAGAQAVRNGADCLMIDAEVEYEGKYVQAQTYIRTLRRLIGPNFPVALAGFPYVDYHPSFPYSVFLGSGGAQYNAPQMYWPQIGVSVDEVYSHTYTFNAPYLRPIFPLGGDLSANPPAREIRRFRQISRAYHAGGVSWWEWSVTDARSWHAIAQPVGPLPGFTPSTSLPSLRQGDAGDLVVWAQLHLYSAGQRITVDGGFGPNTQAAVQAFQSAHGLNSDGVIGQRTWLALLRYRPAPVTWTSSGSRVGRSAAGGLTLTVPKSAKLRTKRYEIRVVGRG